MHQKNNFYISFGIWIAVLPFLGVPGIWKVYLTTLSGLFLVLIAAGPSILKKLQPKASRSRKKSSQIVSDIAPINLRFNAKEGKETKPTADEPQTGSDKTEEQI